MTVDARAEAKKRWSNDTDDLRNARTGFLAGAVWALRKFGDMLDAEGARAHTLDDMAVGVAFMSWASEAHHIADEIEEGS